MATFPVVTEEVWTDRSGARTQRAEWHRIVAFQGLAENCARHIGKGSLVYVEGSLQTRKWQGAEGQQRQATEVRAQRVVFLDRRRPEEGRPAQDAAPSSWEEDSGSAGEGPAPLRRQPMREASGRSGGRWWDSSGAEEEEDPYGA